MPDTPARLSIELGRRKLAAGDLSGAIDEFRAAIGTAPTEPDGYYHLASLLAQHGERTTATQVFALGLKNAAYAFRDPDALTRHQGRTFDAPTTLAFYDALADSAREIRAALTPSEPLGPYAATLSPAQEDAIRARFDAAWDDWRAGRTPHPRDATLFTASARHVTGTMPRVLLLMPEYVSCHPDYVKSTITSHALASLQELGAEVELHAGDHLCFDVLANAPRDDRLPSAQARTALEAHISHFRPDVVVMDGMFTEANGALTRADLRTLKLRYRFKLVTLVPDAYPPLTNFSLHWAEVADLAVALSGRSYLDEVSRFIPTLQAPCQPIAQALVGEPNKTKDIDFLYVGSRRRYRDLWCAHAAAAGLRSEIVLTDRRAATALSEDDFYALLRRARLVVNSGYVAPGLDVVTFRIFEAAGAETLVLNEARAPNDLFFVPNVHYVPFGNVHDMVSLARFLLANEDYRARMARAAHAWLTEHFAGRQFWHALFTKLAAARTRRVPLYSTAP